MTTLIMLLLACSQPPEITAIAPDVGPPGTQLTVTGQNLVEGTAVRLGGKELVDLTVSPPTTVTGRIPSDLGSGPADLVLTTPAGRVARRAAFSVTIPPPSNPCDTSEQRFTHIPPTADVVKIDVHHSSGSASGQDQVERSSIKTRTIVAIEVERTQQGDHSCAAIWLKTDSGRILFDAQQDVDLRPQAQQIANGLHKPLSVGEHVALPPGTDGSTGH